MNKKKKKTARPGDVFSLNTKEEFHRILAKPAVHIDCDGGLCFENCRAVVAYTETTARLDMGAMTVRVEGDGLRMTLLRRDRVLVRGRITSLEFLYGGGDP